MLTNVMFTKGGEQVQCMDLAFGYIFLGCFDGSLLRYNILVIFLKFKVRSGMKSIVMKSHKLVSIVLICQSLLKFYIF